MDIKEIALKVGLQAFEEHPYDKGHVVSPSGYTWIDDKLIEFAEALVAELAKQNEHIGAIQNGKFQWNTDGGPEKWRARKDFSGKLYTIPPTAEQIANETAEACAAYCEAYDLANTTRSGTFCAQSIRSGAWKEFKK